MRNLRTIYLLCKSYTKYKGWYINRVNVSTSSGAGSPRLLLQRPIKPLVFEIWHTFGKIETNTPAKFVGHCGCFNLWQLQTVSGVVHLRLCSL